MSRFMLCPSMSCANFDCLGKEVRALDTAGADIFHVDIGDGELAPRLSMGICDLRSIRRNTNKRIDVHLYCNHPHRYIKDYADAGADIIYIFPESEHFAAIDLCMIRELGKSPDLGVGWGVAPETLSALLPLVDYVMVNIANPVAKQRLVLDFAWDVPRKLVYMREAGGSNFRLLIDWAVSLEVISRAVSLGVDGFVLGTRGLFGQREDYATSLSRIHGLLREYE